MSNVTTWAVLSDGRYIKILINKGVSQSLVILNVDDLKAYSDLCYLMVNGKPLNGTGEDAVSRKIDNIKYQAEFLAEHHKLGLFDLLVLAAPKGILEGLRKALPEQVANLIVGELEGDLTVTSNDDIENQLSDLILAGIEKAS